jgi:predicted RNase H-like HicB family nuclease
MRAYVVFTLKFKKEGRKWVALCEELGTSTFAPTLLEAQKRIQDAVTCHLNALEEVGERVRFFSENNIKMVYIKPREITATFNCPKDRDTFAMPYIYPMAEALSHA